MQQLFSVFILLLLSATIVQAQSDDLVVEAFSVDTVVDAFGVEQQLATGTIINETGTAFADVQILAEIYNDGDDVIGEGVGFLVNQCGSSVPLDFELQPGEEQRFRTKLEFYEDTIRFENIEFLVQGREIDAAPTERSRPVEGIIPVTNREIAGLEWIATEVLEEDETVTTEANTLLYGVGCYSDVFTTYDWFIYDADSDTTETTEHPRTEDATNPETRERLELTDDVLFNRSFLSFPPNGGARLVHQDTINSLFTAEADGTFRRLLDEELFRSTLQGIQWLPEERFIAYYYGAYGDGVTYLVASTAGAYFSTPERFSTPSVTVPTATPDLSRLIVSGTFNNDETPGFYLKPLAGELFEPLFEWETLPGNNFPAPVYRSRGGVQAEDVIYFALHDENESATLYCYDRRESELFELAPLPLRLSTVDRAQMILSPDNMRIALGATGVNGGLWLLELETFDACNL
ncbi:MAG: hypothetical protein AAF787_14710 [Chloroflexota bacterium]